MLMSNRVVIVGDVHGMLTEVRALVESVRLTKDDVLVSAGDLLDKGPNSAGVVRFFRELREQGFNVVLVSESDSLGTDCQDAFAHGVQLLFGEPGLDRVDEIRAKDHVSLDVPALRVLAVDAHGVKLRAPFPHAIVVPGHLFTTVVAKAPLLVEQAHQPVGIQVTGRESLFTGALPVGPKVPLEVPVKGLVSTFRQASPPPSIVLLTGMGAVLGVVVFPSFPGAVVAVPPPSPLPLPLPLGDGLPSERIWRKIALAMGTAIGLQVLRGSTVSGLGMTLPVAEVPLGLSDLPGLPLQRAPTRTTLNNHLSFSSQVV
jgi:hypothetical protein